MAFVPRSGFQTGLIGIAVIGVILITDLVVAALTGGQIIPDVPECPHDADTLPLGNPTLPVGIADVPEFHDCQKFIVRDSITGQLRFDSLFAIFVSPELVNLPAQLGYPAPPGGVHIQNRIRSEFPAGGFEGPAVPGVLAAPFAEIYAEGPYPALGITEPGFWCLVMSVGDTSGVLVWRARMISRSDMPGNTCRQETLIPNPTQFPGTELEARSDDIRGFLTAQVPPVGRWDWDPVNEQHYIGLAGCDGWCEIGDSGFVASRTYNVPGWPFLPLVSTRRVKGWYDEQILALLPGDGQNLTPSLLVGTVFPDPFLGSRQVTDFNGKWVLAAFVQLDTVGTSTTSIAQTALGEYKESYGFDPAMHPGLLNRVYMCRGSELACVGWRTAIPVLRHLFGPPDCKSSDHDDVEEWWVRVLPRGGEGVEYRCVIMRDIEGTVAVPATVRWRWKVWDEGIWARCPEGCCEME